MLDIHIHDVDGIPVNIIDDYEELEETVRYFDSSRLVLRAKVTSEAARSLTKGMYLVPADSDDAYRVEQIERETDENGISTGFINITAPVSGYLNERIAFPPPGDSHDRFSGEAESVMKHYVDSHAGPGAVTERQVPLLDIEADSARGIVVNVAARFDNLADLVKRIGIFGGLGWAIRRNSSNRHEFTILEGVDRTTTVYLDPEMDTVATQRMLTTDLGRKTFGLAAGQGEGADRQIEEVWTGETEPTGWERREGFIDARDIPEDADASALRDRGRQKLLETESEDIFEIDALAFGSFVYGEHYFLGDIVTARNAAWGVHKSVRVVGMKRTVAKATYEQTIELDRPWPTLKDKMMTSVTGSSSGSGVIDYPKMSKYMPKEGGGFSGDVEFKNPTDDVVVGRVWVDKNTGRRYVVFQSIPSGAKIHMYSEDDTSAGQMWVYGYPIRMRGGNVEVENDLDALSDVFKDSGQPYDARFAVLEPTRPIPSEKLAGELSGFSVGTQNNFDQNLASNTISTSLMTFQEAMDYAESQGARLPTLEEVEGLVVANSGGALDDDMIWTQTKAGPNSYFVQRGDGEQYGLVIPRESRPDDGTATAYVRLVAEVNAPHRPARQSYFKNRIHRYPDNGYTQGDDADQYDPKPDIAVMEVTNSTSWPGTYASVVTYWSDDRRAFQDVVGASNDRYWREVHPSSYPTWSAWTQV